MTNEDEQNEYLKIMDTQFARDIKRYILEPRPTWSTDHPQGDWVRFADYEQTRKELEEVKLMHQSIVDRLAYAEKKWLKDWNDLDATKAELEELQDAIEYFSNHLYGNKYMIEGVIEFRKNISKEESIIYDAIKASRQRRGE
jgi:hypothetical protein